MDRIEHLRHVSRKLVRELGLFQIAQSHSRKTPQQWHALIEISKEDKLTVSALAKLLLLSVSATSRVVNSLIQEGLVKIREGEDKREKALFLTEKGREDLRYIDEYSYDKIEGAFEFLSEVDQNSIIEAIQKYGGALEESRLMKDDVKISKLSKSQALRKKVVEMIETIQTNDLLVRVSKDLNNGVLKAEKEFYYNNSSNFWVAFDGKGDVIGSIGLKRLSASRGEIKKFFVKKTFRGKGVAQKLLQTLLKTANKHGFRDLCLGTVETSHNAQRFYEKVGFEKISKESLPPEFEISPLDKVFYLVNLKSLLKKEPLEA